MVGVRSCSGVSRRPRHVLAVFTVVLALSGCLSVGGDGVQPDSGLPLPLSFGFPVPLKTQNGETGNEPSLLITPDGMVFACAPRGAGQGTNLWRSMDSGATFERLGEVIHPQLAPRRSTMGDLGGGDCHLGVDEGGTTYLVDLWVGGVSVASTSDGGQTWSGMPVSLRSGTSDRPWVLGGEAGEVFVTGTDVHGTLAEITAQTFLGLRDAPASGGIWVARSTDGGKTFGQQVLVASNADRFASGGNLARGNGNLYLYYVMAGSDDLARHMVAVSRDHGATWTHKVAAEQAYDRTLCGTYPLAVFPVIAADDTGGVYLSVAYANPETSRWDLMFISSPDGGETWNAPRILADRPGTRLFPWISAASDGRVGVAWYESNQTVFPDKTPSVGDRATCGSTGDDEPSDWFIRYAEIHAAWSPDPNIRETLVQPAPVTQATMLGRPFAELLHVDFDPMGRAAVVYVRDTETAQGQATFALQATPESSHG